MKILIIEPGKHPRVADIEHTLENLQSIVGGYLEAIYPWDDRVALVCDDEAKLKADTQWNRMLENFDIIKGTFFFCGLGEEDFTDLPDDLIEKYSKKFWDIEMFIPMPNGKLQPIILR